MVVRGDVIALHHSHDNTAYSDGMKGYKVNEVYTRSKWGGVVPINEPNALNFRTIATGEIHRFKLRELETARP